MAEELYKEMADFLEEFINFAAGDERSNNEPDYKALKEKALDLEERLSKQLRRI